MPDGGFLLYCSWAVLEFNSGGEFLMRVSAEGDTLWTRPLEFELPDSASIETIQLTSDGKLLLGGCSRNTHWGNCDMFYALADTTGDTLWTGQYTDGITDDDFVATAVAEIADGYALAGTLRLGNRIVFGLLLIDTLGEVRHFQECLTDTMENTLNGMTTTHDGGFLMYGYRLYWDEADNYNGILLKTDSEGDSVWLADIGAVEWWEEIVHAIETRDGGVLAVGRKEWDHDGHGQALMSGW
jgi:drug/metabolite transporter superfamily protein YnfA